MSRQSAVLMAFAGALLLAMLLEGAPLPVTLLAPIAPHHNGTVSDGNQVISAELIESRIVDFRVAYHEILEATKKESHRLSEQTLFLEEMANRYITKYLAENLQPMPLQYRVFRLTMRDGTDIYTRNFVPFGLFKKFSTVFSRSPYSFFTSSLAFLLIIDNHAVVTQDIRGTGKSEGYFDVWRQDGKDGYDTMSWIKSQDWSNGQVFSMGISADGCSAFTQWLEQPSWLKSEWLTWYASNAHDTIYPGGAYRSNLIDNWMGFVCPECIKDIKENEAYSDYWAPVTGRGSYDKITGLTTNWGGWYDIFIETTIDGFNGAQYEGSAAVKGNNFLVVDNGGHCIRGYHPGGRSLLPIRLGFATFGAVRKDENFAQVAADIKKSLGIQAISIFVMGPDVRGAAGNYWTSIPQWPVVTEIPFYLSESNYLSPTAPTGSGSASYAYDPTNPVPTIGGNELFGGCGPQDQTSIEGRSDVLLFTSDALRENIAITGAVRAILYVSSDAVDTDFTVKITDVHPDGRSLLIMDNIVRMKWRESSTNPSPVTPGAVYEVEVKVGQTSYIFNAGHKIRVAVSSSNSPRFLANPNTGSLIKDENGATVIARNTVLFDRSHSSRVILPGVNVRDIPESAALRELSF
eukprot:TRINITY_DN5539_c0_g2_i1.p1 TRINITY_DN5539_c0_g2~~TRINITY_DN5539_c0_g2_i1.p1  ORF type:complete len:632 (-),score=149.39 TRINITY_DN5539_c0_g2_i1:139-2034(-)